MLKRIETDLDDRCWPLPLGIWAEVDFVALKSALDNIFAQLLHWINSLLNSMLLLNHIKILSGLNSFLLHSLVRIFIRQLLCLRRVLFLDWFSLDSV